MEEEHTEKLQGALSDVERGGEAAADKAKREAREFAEGARGKLDSEVSARKGIVARELGNLGDALEVSAREMDKSESSISEPLRQVAGLCNRSARNLSNKGPRELVAQIEGFGREQPLVFFGAAIAAGLVATRLLRSDTKSLDTKRQDTSPTETSGRELEKIRTGPQEERPAFERYEGEAIAEAPIPAVPTSETLNVPGPEAESDRPQGTA